MSTKTNILITGVTGYIGGSVFKLFLEHPDVKSFDLTVLVRSAEKAEKIKALSASVKPVVGSLQDLALLEELASKADYILSLADSDDMNAAKAFLKGAKKYHEATSKLSSYIHTSGTGTIADNSTPGELNTAVQIYDDMNVEQIASIPETAFHRDVEVVLIKADEEGYVKTYIVSPSTIYGAPAGPMVDLGLQHLHSIQIPALVRAALGRGRGVMVGRGQNIWNSVHVDDLAHLYLTVFNGARATPSKIGHGREGVYFAENGEHTLYEVGKAIGEALATLGKAKPAEPTPFTDEEVKKFLWGGNTFAWGSTARARANRGKAAGWKPTRTTKDLLACLLPEVKALDSKA